MTIEPKISTTNSMSNFVPLNKHQKKALVIELYKQGKTRRQIAETVHMSFKDIANIINVPDDLFVEFASGNLVHAKKLERTLSVNIEEHNRMGQLST